MKKIYFAASIRGGQADREIYQNIVEELQKYGQVLTEHIVDTPRHKRYFENVSNISG